MEDTQTPKWLKKSFQHYSKSFRVTCTIRGTAYNMPGFKEVPLRERLGY